jgi:hypothetical protein
MSGYTDLLIENSQFLIENLQIKAENLRLTQQLEHMNNLAREMYYEFRLVACGARSAIDPTGF